MQLRADIQLRAAIKALKETVAPAVDADNKLAIEQLQMVIGALVFVEQNLPLQFQFDCNELRRSVGLARAIGDLGDSDENAERLASVRRAADTAEVVLDRARADPQDVLDAVRNIRAECGAATTALYRDGSVSLRKALADTVLSYSKAQTLRDRSWLLAMGFDSPQSGIPPIDQFFAEDATASTASVVSGPA